MAQQARRASAQRIRRILSTPLTSDSSSSSSSEEDAPHRTIGRRRRSYLSSSRSSSTSEDDNGLEFGDGDDSDTYDDFVDRRHPSRAASAISTATGPQSVAKLNRLRRIFLNKPTKTSTTESTRRRPTKNPTRSESSSVTRSNSSDSSDVDAAPVGTQQQTVDTKHHPSGLSIDRHVQALRECAAILSQQHDTHAQRFQAKLTQAIDELTFAKQQEEWSLQSHIQFLQQDCALRLQVFEQQYRAKVREIQDELQASIAHQRQQSEANLLATATRLQETSVWLEDLRVDTPSSTPSTASQESLPTLTRTAAFMLRHRERELARKHANESASQPCGRRTLDSSPTTKQRAKLRMLEEKLASFSSDVVDRVAKSLASNRQPQPQTAASTAVALLDSIHPQASTGSELRPTPLSPLRTGSSYWHNGISWEDTTESAHDQTKSRIRDRSQPRALSRRFLLPEEERELLALRNSIGLAKDWMEQHQ